MLFGWFAPPPPCPSPALEGEVVQIAIAAFGKRLGVTGIVDLSGDAFSLTLLSPSGPELFHVSGPPYAVQSGIEAWAPWLEHLPVERDLRLAFTEVQSERCSVGEARIRARMEGQGWTRSWRGSPGPASAVRAGDHTTVRGRGYELLIVPVLAEATPDAP